MATSQNGFHKLRDFCAFRADFRKLSRRSEGHELVVMLKIPYHTKYAITGSGHQESYRREGNDIPDNHCYYE